MTVDRERETSALAVERDPFLLKALRERATGSFRERLRTFPSKHGIYSAPQPKKKQTQLSSQTYLQMSKLGAPPQRGINGKTTHIHTTLHEREKKKIGTKPARQNARRVRPTSAL